MAARLIVDKCMTEPDPAFDVAAEWKVARAEVRFFLARRSERSACDTEDESDCPAAAVAEMEGAAEWLANLKPVTIRGAREMLDVAVDILAYRELHSDRDILGKGPVLQILRNVCEALFELDVHGSTEP